MSVLLPMSVAQDSTMRRATRGLLVEILTYPLDEAVTEADLIASGPEGRDAIRRMVRELEAAGYLTRMKHRYSDGRFGSTRYAVNLAGAR